MSKFKIYFLTIIFILGFNLNSNSQSVPASFADLAEKLMPSVVNISTTQTVVTNTNPFPFQFPPGSPFEDMFKEFGTPQERQSTALGSGFIIDEEGIVVTNNHVIQDAEDIIVRVNGAQSVKYGLDDNYGVTAADPKAKFIAAAKNKNKKKKFQSPMAKAVKKKDKKKVFVIWILRRELLSVRHVLRRSVA